MQSLGTAPGRGLSVSSAEAKLRTVGPNEIDVGDQTSMWQLLLHQFADFMIMLLLAAAVISGIVGDLIDTIAIVVIVVLNAAVGVFQEYRAERAIAALRRLSAPSARVVRDGHRYSIPARDVVPGDLLILDAGDVVPADLRLLDVTDLAVDESALTGESVPVAKQTEIVDAALTAEQLHMAFKSTLVTRGRAVGVATATGLATEIGKVAQLLRGGPAARTPLQQRMRKLGRRIAVAVVAICALVFVTGVLRGEPALLMFLTALSLAVAAVPEALPAVITVSLGLGAKRLSERNALVRRLPAVETLGSVTYICADKTGTLTENAMRLARVHCDGVTYDGLTEAIPTPLFTRLGQVLALCNEVTTEGEEAKGEPTERALYVGAREAGFDKDAMEQEMPRVAEVPFESERRHMVTQHTAAGGTLTLIKGAPEQVIPHCVNRQSRAGPTTLDAQITSVAHDMAKRGFRVLALAYRQDSGADQPNEGALQGGWTFIGVVGLIDPPRAEAGDAIRQCKAAGIVPVMITGDHPMTAVNIASRLGIIEEHTETLTGAGLAELTDAELLSRVEKIRVYSRVGPEQKIRIVNALKTRGHFVAMTGDGVNDAPALKQASIGVAMGRRGTEVAREAAEMVLLDDNFATIVSAIHEGRRIFDDIRKFIRYTLTSNSGEIWVLVLAPFFGLPTPLLPLHILWINLVTDGLPGLALSAEPAERNVMRRPPRPPNESMFAHGLALHIFWVGLTIGGLTLATEAWSWHQGAPHWQTMTFTVLVFAQLFHALAIRSERDSLFSIGLASNPSLLVAIAVTVLAQLAVIYIPAFNTVFKTQPLSFIDLVACFAIASSVFFVVELEKLIRRLHAPDRALQSA